MSFVAGASASIMKTISEIEAILDGAELGYGGPKRNALRAKFQAAFIKSSKSWYKKGFNRGHKESYRAFAQTKRIPATLTANVERVFIPNATKKIALKSALTEKFMSAAVDA